MKERNATSVVNTGSSKHQKSGETSSFDAGKQKELQQVVTSTKQESIIVQIHRRWVDQRRISVLTRQRKSDGRDSDGGGQ